MFDRSRSDVALLVGCCASDGCTLDMLGRGIPADGVVLIADTLNYPPHVPSRSATGLLQSKAAHVWPRCTSLAHMIERIGVIVAVILLAGAGGSACTANKRETATPAPPRRAATAAATAATPKPVASTPVARLAGELIMTKLDAEALTPDERAAVRTGMVGGVILFGWNVQSPAQVRALTRELQSSRRIAVRGSTLDPTLLISVDQEGGAIRNVPFAPPSVTQPQLASASPERARSEARATGRALRDVGINIDLGPVADLASAPNQTMSRRAFGSDPSAAARLVSASVAGLQEAGVAAAAKHFPGFGASSANSDEAVAYVDRSLEELREAELVPFRAAIQARAHVIMVSHGIHRSLGSTLPGTLDPRISTKLLRDELGFEGVAMTDSMNARGMRDAWGRTVPQACPRALAAGIDLLLLTGTLETARLCRARIIDAVADGTLSAERVREAAERVGVLRERVGRD